MTNREPKAVQATGQGAANLGCVLSGRRPRSLATALFGLSNERGQEHETNARQEHCVGKH